MDTLYQSITPVGVIMGLGIGSRCELHGQPTTARSILRFLAHRLVSPAFPHGDPQRAPSRDPCDGVPGVPGARSLGSTSRTPKAVKGRDSAIAGRGLVATEAIARGRSSPSRAVTS